MRAVEIDERHLVREREGANFLLYVYEGSELSPRTSWSVASTMLLDTDLPSVLRWLPEHLPQDACWSLGVVTSPPYPNQDSDLVVDWIVGADVLNMPGSGGIEEALAADMLARRDRATLP
jgi:hypothetical protein